MLKPTIKNITKSSCEQFKVSHAEIMGRSRSSRIVEARNAVFYASRMLNDKATLTKIGRYFDRHHTTVMSGVRRADELRDYYPRYCASLNEIMRQFNEDYFLMESWNE